MNIYAAQDQKKKKKCSDWPSDSSVYVHCHHTNVRSTLRLPRFFIFTYLMQVEMFWSEGFWDPVGVGRLGLTAESP